MDQFYRQVYGSGKVDKLFTKPTDQCEDGKYGEREHGRSLVARFYDEEPTVERFYRIAGRFVKGAKRSAPGALAT